jgi:putative PIG3 family NAD(P)H quinone oxidoreductase
VGQPVLPRPDVDPVSAVWSYERPPVRKNDLVYAVTISEPGGPDVLTWTEVPDPVPGADDVLIQVAASAVNRADLLQRQGFYPAPPGAPPYPGLECSGTIISVGGNVTDYQAGERVCALLSGGGYAEQVVVPAAQVLPIPRGVELVDAAGLPEVACTVWSNVVSLAGLSGGETLLVHGGGSGIGTFAIQLGRALGATVMTTARPQKHEHLRELGAHVTIDYTSEDFVARIREATTGRGANVILDIMGGSYLARNIESLAVNGRLVIIGMQGGRGAELDIAALLAKRGSVSATALRSRSNREKAEIVSQVGAHVWPMLEAGTIRPVVHARVPLPDAAEAHRLMEGDHLGKVILVAPSPAD